MSEAPSSKKFYGKYRGTVDDNADPMSRGRLQVTVPDVLGTAPSSWAEACAPLTGPSGSPMGVYLVPPVGAGVWVEFEQGDPQYPIWVGCRWVSSDDVPSDALAGNPDSPSIVLQTSGKNSLVISDVSGSAGGIRLTSSSGAMILINDDGITITNGQSATIDMTSSDTVDINSGALTIK